MLTFSCHFYLLGALGALRRILLDYVFVRRHVTAPLFAISNIFALVYFKAIDLDGLVLERLFHNAANSEQGGLLIWRIIGHAGISSE
jgi:hypothetical protein